jgi:hypothetical protein
MLDLSNQPNQLTLLARVRVI